MDSFMVAVRVVLPMAAMIGIGMLLRIWKLADGPMMKKVDVLIFNVFLPAMSFYNIYKTDFSQLHDVAFILYAIVVVLILFSTAMFLIPKLVHPRPTAAAFGQSLFRSNYLIFGAAVAQSIYGEGNFGLVSLLGAAVVPMYSSLSAILLEKARHSSASPEKLLLSIAKNPTIVATFLGLAVNLCHLKLPELVLDVVQDLSGLATPLSFLSIGVTLSLGSAVVKKVYLVSGILLRLVVVPLIFVPIAVLLGFRGQQMCALMVMLVAPSAVSCYPMAVAMGADGEYSAKIVAYTSLLCLPTIFLWTLLLSSMGLI